MELGSRHLLFQLSCPCRQRGISTGRHRHINRYNRVCRRCLKHTLQTSAPYVSLPVICICAACSEVHINLEGGALSGARAHRVHVQRARVEALLAALLILHRPASRSGYEQEGQEWSEKQKAKSLAFKLSCHAIQRLTTNFNTRHALHFRGTSRGGVLGAWQWRAGEGESGRPGAWRATLRILFSPVSGFLLG
eukprot:1162101-Pelagomonas_calceolata.AAC.1